MSESLQHSQSLQEGQSNSGLLCQQISELLDQMEWIQDNEPLQLFKPNEAQRRWINEIGREGCFICVNAAGNGSGKTYGIVAILGAFCWPDIAPLCFQHDTFIKFKGPKRARIISTPKELEEVGSLQTTIEALWPKGRYVGDKKGKSYSSQYKT